MAETAKIWNPKTKVLIPDLNAGCSLVDSCPTNEFSVFKAAQADHTVLINVNCKLEIKVR